MAAYDRRGNLLRARGQPLPHRQDAEAKNEAGEKTADEEALEAAATEDDQKKADFQLPPETDDDLRPFPLNKNFVSQSILSEDLRLEIWQRVQKQGKSVRQVSMEMGVDMRRVAAVVRLVEVENRMKADVSTLCSPSSLFSSTPMMNNQIRLVLQTSKHGDLQKTNYNSLTSATATRTTLSYLCANQANVTQLIRESNSPSPMPAPSTAWCR
jgi:hypothetical protein